MVQSEYLESLVENVVAKSIVFVNPLNMAKAALQGLMALKLKNVEANRGVRISIKNYTNCSPQTKNHWWK